MNNTEVNLSSIYFLTNQDIDIFNSSDEFYTDICYHFESPNGKDVPLADRIHSFYPNVTLCESNCVIKGVNYTSMESICECKFTSIINNDFIGDNVLLSNIMILIVIPQPKKILEFNLNLIETKDPSYNYENE